MLYFFMACYILVGFKHASTSTTRLSVGKKTPRTGKQMSNSYFFFQNNFGYVTA